MQSFISSIKRHLFVFITTIILIIIADLALYAAILYGFVMPKYNQIAPNTVLSQTAAALTSTGSTYTLSDSQKEILSDNNVWCMLIDTDGNVIWDFELPEAVPHTYSLQDIAIMSRGYLHDYPVFVWKYGEDLLVAGYPKISYVKITTNYFPYDVVNIMPIMAVTILLLDTVILFIAYYFSKRNITKNISPIVDAITRLSVGKQTTLKTKGDLAQISDTLNEAAAILEKNDKARANWISGVSHDIRTPLSMILGYADRIAENPLANENIQEQAAIIRNQSIKIKGLIQDFNLVSKLEYDAQPFTIKPMFPAKLLRNVVAEYLNNGLDKKYSIEIDITEASSTLTFNGDAGLLKRAIENLIQNCINHNPQGCNIILHLDALNCDWSITVSDNGKGVTKSRLINIQSQQHYFDSSNETDDLQHGLGLLIVRQVTVAHNGNMKIESDVDSGFSVTLTFPK